MAPLFPLLSATAVPAAAAAAADLTLLTLPAASAAATAAPAQHVVIAAAPTAAAAAAAANIARVDASRRRGIITHSRGSSVRRARPQLQSAQAVANLLDDASRGTLALKERGVTRLHPPEAFKRGRVLADRGAAAASAACLEVQRCLLYSDHVSTHRIAAQGTCIEGREGDAVGK